MSTFTPSSNKHQALEQVTPLELETPPASPIVPIARGRKLSPLSKNRDPSVAYGSKMPPILLPLIERYGKSKDMSDLVGELLEKWCAEQVSI